MERQVKRVDEQCMYIVTLQNTDLQKMPGPKILPSQSEQVECAVEAS